MRKTHSAPPRQIHIPVAAVRTDLLINSVRSALSELCEGGERPAVRMMISAQLEAPIMSGLAAGYRDIGEPGWAARVERLSEIATELRRRPGAGEALDALLAAELEEIKMEILGRTPGGLAGCEGYDLDNQNTRASAAGTAGG